MPINLIVASITALVMTHMTHRRLFPDNAYRNAYNSQSIVCGPRFTVAKGLSRWTPYHAFESVGKEVFVNWEGEKCNSFFICGFRRFPLKWNKRGQTAFDGLRTAYAVYAIE